MSAQAVLYFAICLCLFSHIHGFAAAINGRAETFLSPETDEDTGPLHRLTNPSNPCVDIVAVHGLDGHWQKSWTAENGVFWLRDLLPSELPCARIYSYGHDSRTRGSDEPLPLDISDHGEALVADLQIARKSSNTDRVPILFIGHSLGGIIIKSALVYADSCRIGHMERFQSIKASTHAVLFLGTPHQGGEGVDMVEILRKISSITSHTNKPLLQKMARNSEWLLELQSRYNAISQDFETTCFYETFPMRVSLVGNLIATKRLIVPKHSAIMFGAPNAEKVPISGDHITIAKFQTYSDDGFQKISKRLKYFQEQTIRNEPVSNKEFALGVTFNNLENQHFTGREDILQSLGEMLHHTSRNIKLNRVVLYGAGGMGKTQIAIKYIQEHESEYTSIFWIGGSRNYSAATSISAAVESLKWHYEINDLRERPWFHHFQKISKTKDVPPKNTDNGDYNNEATPASISEIGDHVLKEIFLRWLSTPGNCGWLMVIDNVDDIESFDFRSWLSSTLCGSLIITTRRQDLAGYWNSIKVDRMTDKEALSLLQRSSGVEFNDDTTELPSSIDLIEELGHLPLAISQAGAHISVNRESIRHYLMRYQKYPKDLLANKAKPIPWESTEETVLTTWEISYTAIRDRNPLAAEILLLCGFLDRNLIAEDLFKSLNGTDFEANQAFRILVSYSLLQPVEYRIGHLSYHAHIIHPLVHLWLRDRMEESKKKSTARQAAKVLRATIKSGATKGHFLREHIAHIFSLYQGLYPCENDLSKAIRMPPCPERLRLLEIRQQLRAFSPLEGWILWLRGQADDIWSFLYHRYIDRNYSDLSEWEHLYQLESEADGRDRSDLLSWTLCRALKSFPPKHPRVLEMIGNYAYSLAKQYDRIHRIESRALYWWLLSARAQVLGPSHPATAGAYLGLGLASTECHETTMLIGTACDIRVESLGYDDYLTRNAFYHFFREAGKCKFDAINNHKVFTQIDRVVHTQGEEKAQDVVQNSNLFATYTARAAVENIYHVSRASLANMIDPELLVQHLEMWIDLYNHDHHGPLWETTALDLLNATERYQGTAMPTESTRNVLAYASGLRVLLGLATELQSLLLTQPADDASLHNNKRWEYNWPVDTRSWRLMLPLVRSPGYTWQCPIPETFFLGSDPTQDPSDQSWVFKWFEPLGPFLIEIKLHFDFCLNRWLSTLYFYLNVSGTLHQLDYDWSDAIKYHPGYICEEAVCEGKLEVLLILMGRLGIDGRPNHLDPRIIRPAE